MTPIPESSIYAALGEDGFARLVGAFYRRASADDVLGPMYKGAVARSGETLADAERKLRDFLVYRFGGPDRYIQARGHPRLRARHMPFPIDPRAAERWLDLMDAAMAEAAVPIEAAATLRPYFVATARHMTNRDPGLPIVPPNTTCPS